MRFLDNGRPVGSVVPDNIVELRPKMVTPGRAVGIRERTEAGRAVRRLEVAEVREHRAFHDQVRAVVDFQGAHERIAVEHVTGHYRHVMGRPCAGPHFLPSQLDRASRRWRHDLGPRLSNVSRAVAPPFGQWEEQIERVRASCSVKSGPATGAGPKPHERARGAVNGGHQAAVRRDKLDQISHNRYRGPSIFAPRRQTPATIGVPGR